MNIPRENGLIIHVVERSSLRWVGCNGGSPIPRSLPRSVGTRYSPKKLLRILTQQWQYWGSQRQCLHTNIAVL